MKKKLLALMLGAAMISAAIAGCGSSSQTADHTQTQTTQPLETPAEAVAVPTEAAGDAERVPEDVAAQVIGNIAAQIQETPAPASAAAETQTPTAEPTAAPTETPAPAKKVVSDAPYVDGWILIGVDYLDSYAPVSVMPLDMSLRINPDGTLTMHNEDGDFTGSWYEKDGALYITQDGYNEEISCSFDADADYLTIGYALEGDEMLFVMAREGSDEAVEALNILAGNTTVDEDEIPIIEDEAPVQDDGEDAALGGNVPAEEDLPVYDGDDDSDLPAEDENNKNKSAAGSSSEPLIDENGSPVPDNSDSTSDQSSGEGLSGSSSSEKNAAADSSSEETGSEGSISDDLSSEEDAADVTDAENEEDSNADPETKVCTLPEVVVFDDQNIHVTFTGDVTVNKEGASFTILVDNGNDYAIALGMLDDHFYINDLKVPCRSDDGSNFVDEQMAEQEVTFNIPADSLELYGIEEIHSVDFELSIQNTTDYNDEAFDTDPVSVKSDSASSAGDTFASTLTMAYDENGIQAAYGGENPKQEEDADYIYPFYIYFRNNTDHPISVMPYDSQINGKDISVIAFEHLLPGKACLTKVFIEKEALDAEEITEIETIDTTIYILNDEDGSTSFSESFTLK